MNSDLQDKKKRWYDIGLRFALNGLKEAIMTERNMKVHMIATLLVIFLAITLEITMIEWMILLLTIAMVIGMELMNTALEHALDYLAPERTKEIKAAKDIAASSVLIVSIMACIIGFMLFFPKIMDLFKSIL